MKKVLCAGLLLILLLVALVGCASSDNAVPIDMDGLMEAMQAADDTLPEMLTVSSSSDRGAELFGAFSDMDYEKVSGFALAYAADGHFADEIAVIQVKSASDVSAAERSLREHLQSRKNLYSTYGPEQVSRVEDALVFTEGNCAVLILSDNGQAVKAAFLDYIG